MCREAAAQGISTSTVGFGEDYDENLLKAMADAGNGNTWYIERVDQASMVFLEEIEGLLSLSAQNLTVTLTGTAAVRNINIWGDWPTVAQGDHITVPLGDLYAREPRRVLIEFVVNNRAAKAIDGAVAQVRLESDVMTDAGGVNHETVTFPIAANLSESARVEPTIETEVLLAQAAKARKEAAERQERGDSGGAANALHQMVSMMAVSPQCGSSTVIREMDDLCALERVLSEEQATVADVKYLKQRSYNQSRGRAKYDEALARPTRRDEEEP
jgi:Ca-activated chloride channel family protein